jgi:hypothetical protein
MPRKALIGLIVADAVAMVAFTLVLIFRILPARQVIFVLVPILFAAEAAFVLFVVASKKRRGGSPPTESSEEVRPR